MRDPEDRDGYAVAFDVETYPDGETEDDAAARIELVCSWLRDIDTLWGNDPTGLA